MPALASGVSENEGNEFPLLCLPLVDDERDRGSIFSKEGVLADRPAGVIVEFAN